MTSSKKILIIAFVFSAFLLSSVSSFAGVLPDGSEVNFGPGKDPNSVSLSTSINMGSSTSGGGGFNSNNPVFVSPLVYVSDEYNDYWEEGGQPLGTKLSCDPRTYRYSELSETNTPEVIEGTPEYINAPGFIWSSHVFNRNGEEIGFFRWCQSTSTRVRPPIATPPTYAQIWQSVFNQSFIDGSTSSGAFVAPYSPGLTGMPSKFWAKFPNGQALLRDVNLPNGFRVQTTAEITAVQINLRTPSGRNQNVSTLYPNPLTGAIAETSYDSPAAVYSFRKSGMYVISTGVVWTAQTAVITGPGFPAVIVPLGSLRIEINRDYQVNQLRAGLTE